MKDYLYPHFLEEKLMISYDASNTSLKTCYFVLRYSQCESFRWTGKGLSHIYACTPSPPHAPPIQAATQH